MAGVALERCVGAGQREGRLRSMVEAPELPAVGRMAAGARISKATRVMCVLVATRAGRGGPFVGSRLVAILAGYRRVVADQWKLCQIVVEGDFVAPAGFLMTLSASIAELALVRIDRTMASAAGAGRFGAGKRRRVASLAPGFGVRTA